MPEPSGHLLLIDGLNLVRRVYEAVPAPDSAEKADGALRSSLASIERALKEHEPTHVLLPFDAGGPTFRHERYAAYKAHRKPMPEPLREMLPRLDVALEARGLTVLRVPHVEADDVLATAFLRWDTARRGPVTLLSTDKDLAVLTAQGARVRDHFARVWRDEAWVRAKFGVGAAQLHELLALTGDSSDGIPGIPGVAAKTAARLLNTYGSLDEVIRRADEVAGRLGENLRANLPTLALARELVAFRTDLALGLTWKALRYPRVPEPAAAPSAADARAMALGTNGELAL